MKRIKHILSATAAALVVAGVGAPLAVAKQQPPPGLSPFVQLGWEETTYDSGGRVVGQKSGVGPASFGAATEGAAAAQTTPDSAAASTGALPAAGADGTESVSGNCKTVRAWVTRYTLFGFVAYRWNHSVYFCWSYPRITSFQPNAYISNNDGTNYLRNIYAYGYWYTWSGSAYGGHYSWRQGQVENCVFKYGCIGTTYPWVHIYINGNGAWAANGGGV